MYEFVMLEMNLMWIGTCMWLNCEIELHNVVIWLVHVYVMFEPKACINLWMSNWSSRTYSGFSRILMSARAGKPPLEREFRASSIFADLDVCSSGKVHTRAGSFIDRPSARAPDFTLERNFDASSTFCRHGVRSSEEVDARAGSYVDKPSARVAEFTLEQEFDVTSTFAGLKGLLERGSPRSSGDPVFWNSENAFCVLFSVPFHF